MRVHNIMNSTLALHVPVGPEEAPLRIANKEPNELLVVLHDRMHHQVATLTVHCV